VLLAWAMNGQLLPAAHGAPVRVAVPSHIGARSVKWVQRITARQHPSANYFQATAYRLLPAEADPSTTGPGVGLSLGPVAPNAGILRPDDAATMPIGPAEVAGYAFAGEDRASPAWTSPSTAAGAGCRPISTSRSAPGRGGTGGAPSTGPPAASRSPPEPGTPRPRPSPSHRCTLEPEGLRLLRQQLLGRAASTSPAVEPAGRVRRAVRSGVARLVAVTVLTGIGAGAWVPG